MRIAGQLLILLRDAEKPIPAPSHQGRLILEPGRGFVVAAVATTFQLLVLPAGVPAPPKLVLAGSHCFLLAPVTAIYNVHRVDVRSWPPPIRLLS